MKCEFVKFSPTQNMTILVTSAVPRNMQRGTAERLMAYDGVHAEQVGFIETPSFPGAGLRLQMMGGEFCGNAAMCAAVLACRETSGGDAYLEVSGAQGLVQVQVRRISPDEDGGEEWQCRVEMPAPEAIYEKDGLYFVRMPGITHAVMPGGELSRQDAQALLRNIAREEAADALGLIMYSRSEARITPLVYVRATDTMVWERGCGSGSAAVGALEAYLNKRDRCVSLIQPGGVITSEAKWENDRTTAVAITGKVRITAEGKAYI